jgi:hypothetical protein
MHTLPLLEKRLFINYVTQREEGEGFALELYQSSKILPFQKILLSSDSSKSLPVLFITKKNNHKR